VDFGLRGAGVLVTGGAGGIGTAVVRAFATEGARVAVHYRTSGGRGVALAQDVAGVALAADLRDEREADDLVPRAVDALGRLDVVVANAGVWPREPVPVAEMSLDRWHATLGANVTVTFLTARAALRHFAAQGSGALVLVGSTAGLVGEEGHADYAAAKAAVTGGLLPSLKNEAARHGALVRVNAVAPGWTASPMVDRDLTPAALARATSTVALRKVAAPADVAAAVVFLASPAAAGHLTGVVLPVHGGMEGRLLHAPDPDAGLGQGESRSAR
jgi:3-oxoacyl-[acyl-carrier protein] reductase